MEKDEDPQVSYSFRTDSGKKKAAQVSEPAEGERKYSLGCGQKVETAPIRYKVKIQPV